MKHLFLAMGCAVLAAFAGYAEERSAVVDMRAAGELEARLADDLLSVESLTVSGPVNEADIKTMWKATYHGRLCELNLAGADVEGRKIPDNAFGFSNGNQAQCSALLRSIILPDDVTEIGIRAFFGMALLERVRIPKALTRIGELAFSGCANLHAVDGFSECRLTAIDGSAFSSCAKLSEVRFPETLKTIGNGAFVSSGITSAILPRGVERVGVSAFAECRSLREASIPEGAVCESGAFDFDPQLEELTMLGRSVAGFFARGGVSLRKLRLPNAASVGEEAFAVCQALESVELAEGLETLAKGAFNGCQSVKTLILPSSLTTIEYHSLCLPGLVSLYCQAAVPPAFNNYMPDWGGPFASRPGTANNANVPKDIPVYVPVGSAALYRSAPGWDYFTNYREIAAFPSLTELENAAVKPHIEVAMTRAGELAERLGDDLRQVKSLTVAGPVNQADFEAMRDAAFNGSLEELDLSAADVDGREIPKKAFATKSFDNVALTSRLCKVVLPENIEEIADEAFSYSLHLDEINIPKSVKRIGSKAFWRCENLATDGLTLPEGLVEIGDGAFQMCSSLRNVAFPGSLQSIGANAFASSGIVKAILPYGVRNIGAGAFSSCGSLEEAYLPNSVTDLSESADLFMYDNRLVGLRLPDGVKALPPRMMNGCQTLASIGIPQSVESVGSMAFSVCRSLEKIHIPANVAEINSEAFRACFLASQIVLPDAEITLEAQAFQELPNLERIYARSAIPAKCQFAVMADEQIGPFQTYYGNPPVRDPSDDTPRDIPVYVPRGSKEAYQQAPGWNYFTNFIEVDEFPEAGVESVAAADAAIRMRAEGGRIVIDCGPATVAYTVYTLDGRVAAAGNAAASAAVPVAPGLYIVKCASLTAKVAVP